VRIVGASAAFFRNGTPSVIHAGEIQSGTIARRAALLVSQR
jgi:hypothetical protein